MPDYAECVRHLHSLSLSADLSLGVVWRSPSDHPFKIETNPLLHLQCSLAPGRGLNAFATLINERVYSPVSVQTYRPDNQLLGFLRNL